MTVYSIAYRNRLLGIALCPPTATCATGFGNVGSVSSAGVEGVIAQNLGNGFKITASGSYNSSTFDGDYRTNQSDPTTTVHTAGKDVPDAPRLLGNAGLTTRAAVYRRTPARGSSASASSPTPTISSTTRARSARRGQSPVVRWRISRRAIDWDVSAVRSLDLQLNVNNLFDKRYISTIGSNGFTPSSDFQTLMTGAPRQVFLTVSTTF